MQKELKKILSLGALVFGVVFLAGCGNSVQTPQAPQTPKDSQAPKAPQSSKTNPAENDSTNLNGNSATSATNEDTLLSQEDSDARDAVPSDQETNDLTSSYDN